MPRRRGATLIDASSGTKRSRPMRSVSSNAGPRRSSSVDASKRRIHESCIRTALWATGAGRCQSALREPQCSGASPTESKRLASAAAVRATIRMRCAEFTIPAATARLRRASSRMVAAVVHCCSARSISGVGVKGTSMVPGVDVVRPSQGHRGLDAGAPVSKAEVGGARNVSLRAGPRCPIWA